MRSRIMRLLLVSTTLILVAATAVTAQPRTLKVGLLAPITGPNPDWGKKEAVGMKMAVDNVNKRGGVMGTPLEAVILDTGGDPQQALAMYQRMTGQEGVLVTIGPLFSEEFEALSAVTNDAKVAIIATAAAKPGLSDLAKRPYAFRMTVTSDKKEAPVVKAWTATFGIKKVVIINDQESDTWVTVANKIWPTIMKDLNVEILNLNDPLIFRPGEQDFGALVKRIGNYQADGICIAGLPEETGHLVKEIRRQGLKQPIMVGSAAANPKVIEIAGEAAEGLWSISLFYPEDPNPKVRDYVRDFKRACQEQYPGMNCDSEQYDVVVHDSLLFIADIMKKKAITGNPEKLQGERDKIRDGLTNIGIWRGTAGMMSFDQKGDGIRTIHVVKVKDGRWQPAY